MYFCIYILIKILLFKYEDSFIYEKSRIFIIICKLIRIFNTHSIISIFLQYREEYVLLKPEYVLPEFILHLHYVPITSHTNEFKNSDIIDGMKNAVQHIDEFPRTDNSNIKKNPSRNIVVNTRKINLPHSLVPSGTYTGFNSELKEPTNNTKGSNDKNSKIFSDIDSIGHLFMKNKMDFSEDKNEIEITPIKEKKNLSYSRQIESSKFISHKQAIIKYIDSIAEEFNHKKIKMLNTAYCNFDDNNTF